MLVLAITFSFDIYKSTLILSNEAKIYFQFSEIIKRVTNFTNFTIIKNLSL